MERLGGTLQLSITITVLAIVASIANGAVNTTDPNGCTVNYESYPDTRSLNGQQLNNMTTSTLDMCLQFCVNNVSCWGVEWNALTNSDYGCWWHRNKDDFKDLFDGTGGTQFQFNRTCPSSNVTVATTGTTIKQNTTTTVLVLTTAVDVNGTWYNSTDYVNTTQAPGRSGATHITIDVLTAIVIMATVALIGRS